MIKARDPKELFKILNKFKYGPGKGKTFKEYKTMSPIQFENEGEGTCFDYTKYEYEFFKSKFHILGIVYFMYCNFKEDLNGKTHTFFVYKDDNKYKPYHWFECACGNHEGIHNYETKQDLVNDAFTKFSKDKDNKNKTILIRKVNKYSDIKTGLTAEQFINKIYDCSIPVHANFIRNFKI